MKKAIFPGSFDPITLGHIDIIERGANLFDEIIIAIGINADKKYMFSLKQRVQFIEACFADNSKIKVATYKGLTVDFCKENNVDFILRGLRNTTDFEFEKSIANANNTLAGLESVFLLTSPKTSYISSSIVRDIVRNNGDYTKLVPKSVII